MRVVDPTLGVWVELAECRQCASFRNYVGVVSPRTAKPFVIDMLTLESMSVGDAPLEVSKIVVDQHTLDEWTERMQVACADVRAGVHGVVDETREAAPAFISWLNKARVDVSGWAVVETVLRAQGYTLAEIATAYVATREEYARPLTVDVSSLPVQEGVDDMNILKAVFMAGAGGSGKGRVAAALAGGAGLKVINADTHLERLLKDAEIPMKDVGMHYGLFNKARDLRNKELRQYAMRRLGLLIDSTAWEYSRIAEPVKKLRRLGYDVYMVFVTTSLDTALSRNIARGQAGGRDVPDSFVATAHRGAHENMPDYLRLFGHRNFFLIDNDRDMPDAAWDKVVGQRAAKIGREILTRPIRNPAGLDWIAKQSDPARADYNSPKSLRGWDVPKPKTQLVASAPKPKASGSPLLPATGTQTDAALKSSWQKAQARLDWKKQHPGKPVPPELKG